MKVDPGCGAEDLTVQAAIRSHEQKQLVALEG